MATNIKSLEKQTNEALAATNERMSGIEDMLKTLVERSTDAQHNPVSISKSHEVGGDETLEPSQIIDTPDGPEIKIAKGDVDQEVLWQQSKEEIERFMHEKLTVEIHDTSEKEAQRVFFIGVNGKQRIFIRGQKYEGVERFYVEGLARARPVTYGNQQYKMSDGTDAFKYPAQRGTRFPFAVIGDSDKGVAWLNQIQQER